MHTILNFKDQCWVTNIAKTCKLVHGVQIPSPFLLIKTYPLIPWTYGLGAQQTTVTKGHTINEPLIIKTAIVCNRAFKLKMLVFSIGKNVSYKSIFVKCECENCVFKNICSVNIKIYMYLGPGPQLVCTCAFHMGGKIIPFFA